MGRVPGKVMAMLVATACAGLGGCHRSSGGNAAPMVRRDAAGAVSGGAAAHPAGPAADSGPTDLVAAVSGGGADDGQVGLKFQVRQRPVAGRPVVVMLRLVANQALEHLEARFHPDDGLDVSQGGDFDPEGHLDAGAAVDHNLTLVPAHEGIYTVMATVTTGTAAEAVSRSFVIPIVVGSGPPATKPF
jgi:hypothetical protein